MEDNVAHITLGTEPNAQLKSIFHEVFQGTTADVPHQFHSPGGASFVLGLEYLKTHICQIICTTCSSSFRRQLGRWDSYRSGNEIQRGAAPLTLYRLCLIYHILSDLLPVSISQSQYLSEKY